MESCNYKTALYSQFVSRWRDRNTQQKNIVHLCWCVCEKKWSPRWLTVYFLRRNTATSRASAAQPTVSSRPTTTAPCKYPSPRSMRTVAPPVRTRLMLFADSSVAAERVMTPSTALPSVMVTWRMSGVLVADRLWIWGVGARTVLYCEVRWWHPYEQNAYKWRNPKARDWHLSVRNRTCWSHGDTRPGDFKKKKKKMEWKKCLLFGTPLFRFPIIY